MERMDWRRAIPSQRFCMQAVRAASGGVRKVTVIFASGQVDLVVVPAVAIRFARLAFRLGVYDRIRAARIALNEIATCLVNGYHVIKGENAWGEFYARVVSEMPGVRLNDSEIAELADVFLCELLWILQKIDRGELMAAQYALHRQLSETNFRLLRELRLRRNKPLPSFGLGRRIEFLVTPQEQARVRVEARPIPEELRIAARQMYLGMAAYMAELVPVWKVPTGMYDLLRRSGALQDTT